MTKKTLILLGGGHSHSLLLRSLRRRPLPDLDIVLVSAERLTPYSGLLPSVIAGHIPEAAMQIDLPRLAASVGVRFIEGELVHIDVSKQRIELKGPRPVYLGYDILSINIGAETVAKDKGLSVKPLARFLAQWERLAASRSLTIIGAGAAGVEIALSARHRLGPGFPIQIVHRGKTLLPGMPPAVQKAFTETCLSRGIDLRFDTEFQPRDGRDTDFVLWCSSAMGPEVLASSHFARDEEGFLLTDDTLRCLGQNNVFAAGDVAKIVGQERPRAGVYAVRLAKPLRENIERYHRGLPLRAVRLQRQALAILTRGDRYAVAVRGRWHASGRWLWYVKRFIDLRFMARFQGGS